MHAAGELANLVLSREVKKLEVTKETRSVFEARAKFVDLKRKFPLLGSPADEELLVDKSLVKKPKLNELSTG